MMKKYLLLFILCFCGIITAQITIKDSETREAIPFVNFYDDNQTLIIRSDDKGVLLKADLEKLSINNKTKLHTYNSFYEQKELTFGQLKSSKELLLKPVTINLEEVTVDNKKHKYIKLIVYFRAIWKTNSAITNYTDGVYELYYDKEFEEKKTTIITERRFRKESSEIAKIFFIKLHPEFPPSVSKIVCYSELNKRFQLENKKDDVIIKTKKGDTIKGHIKKNNFVNLDLTLISEDRPRKGKKLGFEAVVNYANISSSYKENTDLKNISISNLSYYKQEFKFKLKKKSDKNYKNHHGTFEIFVKSISFEDKIKTSTAKEAEYWKHINSSFYKKLSDSTEKVIKTLEKID